MGSVFEGSGRRVPRQGGWVTGRLDGQGMAAACPKALGWHKLFGCPGRRGSIRLVGPNHRACPDEGRAGTDRSASRRHRCQCQSRKSGRGSDLVGGERQEGVVVSRQSVVGSATSTWRMGFRLGPASRPLGEMVSHKRGAFRLPGDWLSGESGRGFGRKGRTGVRWDPERYVCGASRRDRDVYYGADTGFSGISCTFLSQWVFPAAARGHYFPNRRTILRTR